jgi:hypothetical protein
MISSSNSNTAASAATHPGPVLVVAKTYEHPRRPNCCIETVPLLRSIKCMLSSVQPPPLPWSHQEAAALSYTPPLLVPWLLQPADLVTMCCEMLCCAPIARYTNLRAMSLTALLNSWSVMNPGMGGRPKQGGM